MKTIDLKKEYKNLYNAKIGKFDIVEVPQITYLQIHGKGNPNTDISYASSVEALYSIAYTLKFACKKDNMDCVAAPLEGLWYADNYTVFKTLEKEKWNWTMMLSMPQFITDDAFKIASETAYKKKNNEKVKEVILQPYDEGLVLQTLHIGPYIEEAPLIAKMHKFIEDNGYKLNGLHHEIYLNDPKKVEASKVKVILRQPIIKK